VKTAIIKLALLLSVLLMPFGMAPVAASGPHQAMAGMPMGHCPDPSSGHDKKAGIAECTMVCAAALPVAVRAADEPLEVAGASEVSASPQALRGLHPDTATPPPKFS